MIEFRKVSLEYLPGRYALKDIEFVLESGSFSLITGHSGAGKSSLLKLIAHLLRPTSGNIRLGDIEYSQLSAAQGRALRQQMGIIFQDTRLLHDRSVYDNVAFPLIIGGFRYRDIRKRVMAALGRVGLAEKAFEAPFALSGGEQQRVGIARAVVARPKLLLADEPTGNLDRQVGAEVMHLLKHFNSSGVTVLLATHDQTIIDSAGSPTLALANGRLSQAADQLNSKTRSKSRPDAWPGSHRIKRHKEPVAV